MDINYEKTIRYTIAITCGLVGFAITYVILGLAIQPIQEWVDNKTIKVVK
ncbi:MAG: hypothetical protein K0R18_150 [Bacillales bacterium]|jgi:hypothetical protein|nr:hypothetical protein [Bacillales bacterium]